MDNNNNTAMNNPSTTSCYEAFGKVAPASRPTHRHTVSKAALVAAACLGTLILGCPNNLLAQDNPGVRESAEYPLGIDPNEKDFLKLRKSIRETVSRALPEDTSIRRILVSNNDLNAKAQDFFRRIEIYPNLFARIELDRKGELYSIMTVYVFAQEDQAKKLTHMGDFPYIQRTGNIVLEFSQNADEQSEQFQAEVGRKLGISPEGSRAVIFDAPLGLDLNQGDLGALERSVMAAVGKVLPKDISGGNIRLSNNPSDPETQKMSKSLGVALRMYGIVKFRKGEEIIIGMQILVTDNEAQAREICDQYVYPYAQRTGNIVVVFDQKEDLSNYDMVVEVAQKLGLSRKLK